MTQYLTGADALGVLQSSNESATSNNSFTSFNSGSKLLVKVLGPADYFTYFGYGTFQPRVNTFAAKVPSKKSAKGYPVENLTLWDRAWKYHADKSQEFQDAHSSESYKYSPKARGSFGFYDLDTGEQIVVDFTKKQANGILAAIEKYGKRLGKLAFELEKTGSSTNTVVSLAPVLDMEEDLTPKQRENFAKAPEAFDTKLFEGIVYEADEKEQAQFLAQAGFDVKLIGLTAPSDADTTPASNDPFVTGGEPIEISDDDLPF